MELGRSDRVEVRVYEVNTARVGPNHLELVSEDPEEILRVLRFLHRAFHEDIRVDGICKVFVMFIREDLTGAFCNDNLLEQGARALQNISEEQHAQHDLF